MKESASSLPASLSSGPTRSARCRRRRQAHSQLCSPGSAPTARLAHQALSANERPSRGLLRVHAAAVFERSPHPTRCHSPDAHRSQDADGREPRSMLHCTSACSRKSLGDAADRARAMPNQDSHSRAPSSPARAARLSWSIAARTHPLAACLAEGSAGGLLSCCSAPARVPPHRSGP